MIAAIRAVAARLASLAVLLAALPAAAAPFPAGPSRHVAAIGGNDMTVFVYRPGCSDPSLLVVFHGVTRNPQHQRDYAQPLADRLCLIVLAPLFDKATYPPWRYQRGGIVRNNGKVRPAQDWTATLALELVAWARAQEGRELPYSLFGHSAGAQFLSRVAAYTPTQAQHIIIADPSSYVLPARDVAAPYGFGKPYPDDVTAALKRYLSLPIAIVLGQEDRGSKNLGVTPGAVAQGANRYERGRAAFKAAQDEAEKLGIALNWRLVELPGVRHSARQVLSSGAVGDIMASTPK